MKQMSTGAAQLVLLVNALNKTRALELVHEGSIDHILDANIGDFRVDLDQQFVR